jgi:hypothetical protein
MISTRTWLRSLYGVAGDSRLARVRAREGRPSTLLCSEPSHAVDGSLGAFWGHVLSQLMHQLMAMAIALHDVSQSPCRRSDVSLSLVSPRHSRGHNGRSRQFGALGRCHVATLVSVEGFDP